MCPVTALNRSSCPEVMSPVRAMWRSSHGRSKGRSANSSASVPGRCRTAPESIPAADTYAQKPSVNASETAWCQRACAASRPDSGITSPSRNTRIGCAAARAPALRARAQPEPAPLLAHQLDVERGGDGQGGDLERRLRAVVDDHDLEQRARPGLPLQPGEGQRQRPGRLVAGHDDADRQRRHEGRGLRLRVWSLRLVTSGTGNSGSLYRSGHRMGLQQDSNLSVSSALIARLGRTWSHESQNRWNDSASLSRIPLMTVDHHEQGAEPSSPPRNPPSRTRSARRPQLRPCTGRLWVSEFGLCRYRASSQSSRPRALSIAQPPPLARIHVVALVDIEISVDCIEYKIGEIDV